MRWQGSIPLLTPTIDGRIITALGVRTTRPPVVYFTSVTWDNIPIGTLAAFTAHPTHAVIEIDVPRRDGIDLALDAFYPTIGIADAVAGLGFVENEFGMIELSGTITYIASQPTAVWPDHERWAKVTRV